METPAVIVRSAGARLAVWEAGVPAAPTIVLVHGYPDTHAVWNRVVPLLADRYHVVAYDMRGMGESTAPSGPRAYALPALAADLGAVAAAVSPDRPVHLVGHDWGAFAAWEALTGPGRAAFASFTSLAGPRIDEAAAWVRRRLRAGGLAALAGQARRSWYVAAFRLPALPELVVGRLAGRAVGGDGAGDPRYPAPTLAADAVAGLALYRANLPRRKLDPVEVPVQLVVPTRDRYISPAFYADAGGWARELRRRDVEAGHWVQRSHPAVVAGAVAEFVAQAAGRRAGASSGGFATRRQRSQSQ